MRGNGHVTVLRDVPANADERGVSVLLAEPGWERRSQWVGGDEGIRPAGGASPPAPSVDRIATTEDRLERCRFASSKADLASKTMLGYGGTGIVFQALTLFDQVLDRLEHAHLRGVIHRDIKPGGPLRGARSRRP